MPTGVLIDTVKTKGKTGFKAFMEVIEYDYPELFHSMTGKEPQEAPPGELKDHRNAVFGLPEL